MSDTPSVRDTRVMEEGESRMRNLVLMLVAVTVCVGLLGCGDTDHSVKKPDNPTPMLDPSKRTGMGTGGGESEQPKPSKKKTFEIPRPGN